MKHAVDEEVTRGGIGRLVILDIGHIAGDMLGVEGAVVLAVLVGEATQNEVATGVVEEDPGTIGNVEFGEEEG